MCHVCFPPIFSDTQSKTKPLFCTLRMPDTARMTLNISENTDFLLKVKNEVQFSTSFSKNMIFFTQYSLILTNANFNLLQLIGIHLLHSLAV